MKLFINGRFLTQKVTGVQRYAIEIVKCLDQIVSEEDEVTILIPPEEIVNDFDLKNINKLVIGKFKGHAWIQFSLCDYVKKHGGELITFAGTVPIFSPGYWTVHDITFIRHPESYDWKFRILYKVICKLSLPKCKKIFTVSEFSKEEISSYFKIDKSKIQVAYSSANYLLNNSYKNVKLMKFGLTENEYYLSVSSRNVHKNQKFIEECAKMYPYKTFVIVGGENKTFNSVKNENISNLIYTGYVTDDELVSLYKHTKGFIFPSLYEGFGLPPLEAVIQGCQAIALSNIPVFNEIYESAYFFNPMKWSEFSFEEFDKTNISEAERKKYIEKYSFEKVAKIYYQIIKAEICV